MDKYTAGEIAAMVGGELTGSPGEVISGISTDSRTLHQPEATLFVAIRGDRHDGHAFIPELLDRGIKAFLVEELPAYPPGNASFILVKDSLKALQALAAAHRRRYGCRVIGITGSNGKTIVSENVNLSLSCSIGYIVIICMFFQFPRYRIGIMSGENSDIYFMKIALQQAEIAYAEGEVPVGAVLVIGDSIVTKTHNRKEGLHDPTAHAEILALKGGAEQKKAWRMTDATLYVTKEPCIMCAGAMVNARLGRLVYGCKDEKGGAVSSLYTLLSDNRLNHQVIVTLGVLEKECAELLKKFFIHTNIIAEIQKSFLIALKKLNCVVEIKQNIKIN